MLIWKIKIICVEGEATCLPSLGRSLCYLFALLWYIARHLRRVGIISLHVAKGMIFLFLQYPLSTYYLLASPHFLKLSFILRCLSLKSFRRQNLIRIISMPLAVCLTHSFFSEAVTSIDTKFVKTLELWTLMN